MKTLFFILLFISTISFSATSYDVGDYINSVKRSKNIVDVFLYRWQKADFFPSLKEITKIQKYYDTSVTDDNRTEQKPQERVVYNDKFDTFEKKFYYLSRSMRINYFHVYYSQETISDVSINTPYGSSKMDLRKRYIITTLKFDNYIEHLGLTYGLALSFCGDRYGFVKDDIELQGNSSLDDGSHDSMDFEESYGGQVYDDLYVLTLWLKPYVSLHLGFLNNFEVDPVDGIFGNTNDIELKNKSRFFFQLDFLGFFSSNMIYNEEEKKAESTEQKISINAITSFFNVLSGYGSPNLHLGYFYSDSDNKYLKSDFISNYNALRTLFFEVDYNYYKFFYIKSRVDFFLTRTDSKENGYLIKKWFFEANIGYDVFNLANVKNPEKYFSKYDTIFYFYLTLGISNLVDARLNQFGNHNSSVTGYYLGLKTDIKFLIEKKGSINRYLSLGLSAEFKYYMNYASKLEHLIESYDHDYFEWSISFHY